MAQDAKAGGQYATIRVKSLPQMSVHKRMRGAVEPLRGSRFPFLIYEFDAGEKLMGPDKKFDEQSGKMVPVKREPRRIQAGVLGLLRFEPFLKGAHMHLDEQGRTPILIYPAAKARTKEGEVWSFKELEEGQHRLIVPAHVRSDKKNNRLILELPAVKIPEICALAWAQEVQKDVESIDAILTFAYNVVARKNEKYPTPEISDGIFSKVSFFSETLRAEIDADGKAYLIIANQINGR